MWGGRVPSRNQEETGVLGGGKPEGMKLVLGVYPHLGVGDAMLALGL